MSTDQALPALQFVWLEVSDLDRARTFYGQTLGLPVQENGDAFVVASLQGADLYLAPGSPTPGNMYLAIAVADIDQFHQQLVAKGLDLPAPSDEGWARYIELTDPDGYRLLFFTPVDAD